MAQEEAPAVAARYMVNQVITAGTTVMYEYTVTDAESGSLVFHMSVPLPYAYGLLDSMSALLKNYTDHQLKGVM